MSGRGSGRGSDVIMSGLLALPVRHLSLRPFR